MLQESLRQRNELLRRVLEITLAQPALVELDDMNPLLDNIAARQRVLDELQALTAQLPPADERGGDPACAELDRSAHELQQRIMEQDKRNEDAAQKRLEDIKLQLRKLRDGKKAFSGYEKQSADPGATYFDKRK